MKFNRSRKVLFGATACSMTIYITWRLFFTIPFTYGVVPLFFGILLLISEILSIAEVLVQYWQVNSVVELELPEIPEEWYSDVDVLIATHNESYDLLYKTVSACTYMEYPDKNKVHIYLCDDNNRPEIRKLAKELKVGYFGLEHNTTAKAGNLNHAIDNTSSPLIATFDADMIPRKEFLMRTVPYFSLPYLKKDESGTWVKRRTEEVEEAYKIGFIQTPQSFYNPDLFQYNLFAEHRVPNEQDYFFREINVGRNSVNAPIYAGSNTVISRKALAEVGGIAIDTITEDFETGLNIQGKGYTTYAISEVLAHGLAPTTMKSLISQRERWARGCIQSLRNSKILSNRNFTKWEKLSYIMCAVYWFTFLRRFIFILSPILFALFHIRMVDCHFVEMLVFWVPSYLLFNKVLSVISGNIRNQHWSNIIDSIMFPYLIISLLLETAGIKKKKFEVTKKDFSLNDNDASLIYATPHLFLLGASMIAILFCFKSILDTSIIYDIIILYWLIVNSKNLILAVFFMFGRKNYRQAERHYIQMPIEIQLENRKIQSITTDLSENGLAFSSAWPFFLPSQDSFTVSLESGEYHASIKARMVHVEQIEDSWKYCVTFCEMEGKDKQEYNQILFDRPHTLPHELDHTLSVYDDFYLNINKRRIAPVSQSRKLPRIQLDIPLYSNNEKVGDMKDFNYQYATLSELDNAVNTIKIGFASDIELELEADDSDWRKNKKEHLFRVCNWESLVSSVEFNEMLRFWTYDNVFNQIAATEITTLRPLPKRGELHYE